jgi:Na+(H+)/acetate symporter ActP
MWPFLFGMSTMGLLLKLTGYASISWLAVFSPIVLTFLFLVAIILICAKA